MICGRRWGKTRLGVAMTTADALCGGRAWWVAPTYKIANEGWLLLKRLAVRIPGANISRSDRIIEMPNGGTAEVRSADNPDSLVGAGLTSVVLDEAADMQAEAWGESLRPALADRRGSAMFITTPKGFSNWTYMDLWERCDEDPKNWHRWRMPSWTNPFLPPDEIEQMKRDMNPAKFSQEVAAEFVSMEGRVFPDFTRERHAAWPVPFEPELPVVLGWDFGYRVTAIVACQVDKHGALRIFEDAELNETSTHKASEWVKRQPWANRITMIGCDPAAQSHDIQTGLPDVQILRGHFPAARVVFSTAPAHRNPEARAGFIRDRLWNVAGERRIIVDPRCKNVIRMFESSVYRDTATKDEPEKDSVIDHMRDALGYLIVNQFYRGQAEVLPRRPW